MNDQPPVPAGDNTFERIKRVSPEGNESWSARDLARVLEYTNFRNFFAVIAKAREACTNSGHAVSDHIVESNEMVGEMEKKLVYNYLDRVKDDPVYRPAVRDNPSIVFASSTPTS